MLPSMVAILTVFLTRKKTKRKLKYAISIGAAADSVCLLAREKYIFQKKEDKSMVSIKVSAVGSYKTDS